MHRILKSRALVAVASSLFTAALVLGSVAYADGDGQTIAACADKATGNLRLMGNKCLATEKPVQWSVTGPTGPAGPAGYVVTSSLFPNW
jgi:hypothetical protein